MKATAVPWLLALAALAFGLVQGAPAWFGLVGVVAGIAVLAVWLRRRSWAVGVTFLAVLALVEILQAFALAPGPRWPGRHAVLQAFALLAGIAILIALGYRAVRGRTELLPHYRVLLLGLLACLAVMAIAGAPVLHDVQQYHDQAADRLLQGQPLNGDPYEIDGPWLASPNYPYMPFEAVLRAPFSLLGDVRLAGLTALLATYPIVLALARAHGFDAAMPDVLATLVVAGGAPLAILQNAWTEPLALPFLAGGLLAHARGRRLLAGVLLGLAAATKLWLLILIPAAWSVNRRAGAAAAAAALATVLPFALQDLAGLVDGAVLFHLELPVRLDGVTLARWAPWWPTAIGGLAWLAGSVLLASRRRTMGWALALASLALALLFFLGKQANANYWWILPPILVLAATASPITTEQRDVAPRAPGVAAA